MTDFLIFYKQKGRFSLWILTLCIPLHPKKLQNGSKLHPKRSNMTKKIRFTKMHGCGNDYIYINMIENEIADPQAAAIAWSDRHKGIGSDGLVLIDKSLVPEADFSMRIFNADGSEAMMCGNASRCIGKYLFERGLTDKTEIRLLTLSGIKTLSLHVEDGIVESVTVDMLEPVLENESQFIESRGIGRGTFVSMGNPHYVIFTDDVDQVGESGRTLERHPAFPQRCNIEFARIEDDGSIRTRVWERGSGITQACGTGACATAVAAVLTGRAERTSKIVMDGGTLTIEWRESDNHVYMTGPAEFVFDGEIEMAKLQTT
jgi:diaminopimelate epimerase